MAQIASREAQPALPALMPVMAALEALRSGGPQEELVAATSRAVTALKASSPTAGEAREAQQAAAEVWNAAIALGQERAEPRDVAAIKQCASDLLVLVPVGNLPPHEKAAVIHIFRRTGEAWAALEEYEAADAAYSKGLESAQWLQDVCFASRNWGALEQECGEAYFGLLKGRMGAARELGQQMLASALMAQAREFACDERLPARDGNAYRLDLVHQLRVAGTSLAQAGKSEQAAPLLSLAYELLSELDSSIDVVEAAQNGVRHLACQVLLLLAWCHAAAQGEDSAQQALNCIQALQALDEQGAGRFTVPFLSHKIYLQMGRFGEAETELLSVVSHEDSLPEVCLAALIAALGSAEGLQSARAALPIVMERFQEDTTLILGLTSVLAAQAAPSEELEALVLEAVADDRALEVLREEPEHRAQLRTLLWNHAQGLLEAQQAERALRFFSTCLAVAEGTEESVQALRAQALCCTMMQSFDRALEYVGAAEEAQPRSLATGFLRLKVSLAAHDSAAAAAAVTQLVDCEGVTSDVLRVACIEALDAGEDVAAKQALLVLLEAVSAGDGQYEPGYEATIFQNLIKLIMDSMPAPAPEGGAASMDIDGTAAPAAKPTRSCELAKYLDQAVERMRAVGAPQFFAAEDGKPMQQEWMAHTAWSAAVEASAAGQLQQASVLMGSSGEFWAAHPQPSAATLSKQKLAFLFAATAALSVYDERPGYEAALALMGQYLLAAKAAAAAAQRVLPLGAAPADGKADAFLLLMEFELATRRKDAKGQLDIIERAQAVPSFTAEGFAKMAALCKEGPHKNLDVCKAAELAALRRLTSEPSLNYAVLAATLRSLIELSSSDDEKIALLSEAQSIINAAPQALYPERELQWVAVTAWNRGALHSRYSDRSAEAARYMQLGHALLARHLPALAAQHKAIVEPALEQVLAGPITPLEQAGRSGRTAPRVVAAVPASEGA